MISTIIVNYNSSDLLTDCLDSLKKQLVIDNGKIVQLEIIIIDNNSSLSEREKLYPTYYNNFTDIPKVEKLFRLVRVREIVISIYHERHIIIGNLITYRFKRNG